MFTRSFRGPRPRNRAAVLLTRSALRLILATSVTLAWACGEAPVPAGEQARADSVAAEITATPGRLYERVLAFSTLEPPSPTRRAGSGDAAPADTALVVPLLFTARSGPEGVQRRFRGWVARGGAWESFADQGWDAPPSRTPWRIVPRRPLRLVLGPAGALGSVIFREPPRHLELDLGQQLAEWTGPLGTTYALETSSALLGTRRFEGITLDLSRARDADDPSWGDWAFLVSGDSVQIVLESPRDAAPGTEGAFRGYGRVHLRTLQWPEVTVEWSESRAFEPARRDVPGAWRFGSIRQEISGSFRAESAQLEAGTGQGPVLPVDGLFTVSGTVQVEGSVFRVRGVYHHRRE